MAARVGLGHHDHADQALNVVTAGHEFIGQIIQRFTVCYDVLKIIDRLIEPAPDQLGPHAVDHVASEVAVVRAGHFISQLRPLHALPIKIALNIQRLSSRLNLLRHRLTKAALVFKRRIRIGIIQ